ncbi:VOC family protein [Chroococcidiopsidales cyanobacterium LEGE 13417]|nr:VOC family protein [Chroococcidiopsidales cyanobacterium LEGE 13417]
MSQEILGIHHVTAIASDPQKNLNFYAGFLGLRLVKVTVNFDDPETYHFYYGDELGRPGTIMTFFVWSDAPKGRQGTGQATIVSFAIPQASLGYWIERCIKYGIRYESPEERFGESVLSFKDPDGLMLELVATANPQTSSPWSTNGIPAEHAIRGIHTVMLCEDGYELTAKLLTETMGWNFQQQEGNIFRYQINTGGSGKIVDVRCAPDFWKGAVAVGTVHHVAWRTRNDEEQEAWRSAIANLGFNVTPVLDRQYFHSIYFQEPGGIIFELATDAPGFTVDEAPAELGTHLMLPPWLEKKRQRIEAILPSLYLPQTGTSPIRSSDHRPQTQLGFTHRFIPAAEPNIPYTLLLLHGTGGDETDLLWLGEELIPDAGILSPRGQVLENGMPRFFRRLAEGIFDPEDLKFRTHELANFVATAADSYGFEPDRVVAVGYSNGANIAVSMLLLRPYTLSAAVLFRPMVPLEPSQLPSLTGIPIFIAAGRNDSIVSPEETERLVKILQTAGADVTLTWHPGGHALSGEDVQAAKQWLLTVIS